MSVVPSIRRIHRPVAIIVGTTALLVALAGCGRSGPTAPPPMRVAVAKVVAADVPTYDESVGTTDGFVNAQIRPKVTGYLLKQDYKDGAFVKAGQLLFEIDSREYKAALDQALGSLAQQQAELTKNQQDLARYTPLYKQGVVARQAFDAVTQATRASAAQVESARAAVEAARLNLQWTKVYSPIDGAAGIAQAQIGDLVTSTTLLTTISQLNPIKVTFPISEKQYLKFAAEINAQANGKPQGGVEFHIILDNGRTYGYPGSFYAAGRNVDPETGTIMIQITFPNPESILRPGMYAKVRVTTGVDRGALLVPQSAVFEIQGQYQVAVVGAENRAHIRAVTPGKKFGSSWIIDSGVAAGDRVVAEGVQSVRNGELIAPYPAPDVSPTAAKEASGAETVSPSPVP